MKPFPLLLAISQSGLLLACASQTVTGGIGESVSSPVAPAAAPGPAPVVRTIAETPATQAASPAPADAKGLGVQPASQPTKASVAEAVSKKVKLRLGSKKPPPSGTMRPDGTYALSDTELAMNCKKLTGRTVIRILQIRDYELSQKTSGASRQMQQIATPVFGGSTFGADPDADYKRDRAAVEAYNRRLGDMNCKVFDLVKELQPKPASESPALVKR